MTNSKRVVKVRGWALGDVRDGKIYTFGGKWLIFNTQKQAREYDESYDIFRCEITYSLPTTTKKKKV